MTASLERVLKSTYSAMDLAFALQVPSPALSNIRRDLTRSNYVYFPRKVSAGRGGGENRYAHALELGVVLALTNRKPPIARLVIAGLARLLQGNAYGIKKINAMSDEDRDLVINHGSEWQADDFPVLGDDGTGRDYRSPGEASRLVDFPSVYLNDDFISRDPVNPTYLIYDPAPGGIFADVKLVGDLKLSEVREAVIALRSRGMSDPNNIERIKESSDDLPVLNLTTILSRIDARLEQRLKAQEIRGF